VSHRKLLKLISYHFHMYSRKTRNFYFFIKELNFVQIQIQIVCTSKIFIINVI